MIKHSGLPFLGGRTRNYTRLDEMPEEAPKKRKEYKCCECGYGPLPDDGSKRAKEKLCLVCYEHARHACHSDGKQTAQPEPAPRIPEPREHISYDEFMQFVTDYAKHFGTIERAARTIGVNRRTLNAVLNKVDRPGNLFLSRFGYRKVKKNITNFYVRL